MKTKNKILLGITAASGVVASFGAAFALYIKPAEGSKIGIGIGTVMSYTPSSDGVKYNFGAGIKAYKPTTKGEKSTDTYGEEDKLNPTNNKVYIEAPLSFEYTYNEGQITLTAGSEQTYAAGTLKVQVDVNSSIAKVGNVVVTAELGGYDYDTGLTVGNNYFMAKKQGNKFIDATFDSSSESTSVTNYIDTGVANDKKQYCLVTLDFSKAFADTDANGDTNDNFLNISDISNAFTVTFNWGDYNFDNSSERGADNAKGYTVLDKNLDPRVYIRGDKSSWKDFNEYRMVPNLRNSDAGAEKVQWMYTGLTGFSKIKVKDNAISEESTEGWANYNGNTDNVTYENGDAKLNKDNYKYGVYYVRDYGEVQSRTFTMANEGQIGQ